VKSAQATREVMRGSIAVPSNRFVQDWKAEGKKIIGFHCIYVPEEIIYAAGVFPFRIRPVGCMEVSSADVYMTGLHCTFARGCLEFILDGKLDFLNGLVSTSSCDNIRSIHDICERAGKGYSFMHFIDVPYVISDESIEWYKREIAQFKNRLEGFLGIRITEGDLGDALRVYNETRRLIEQFYELRKKESPPVSGSEAMSITLAAGAIPRNEYNRLLSETIKDIQGRNGISKYRARLMIMGSALDDLSFFQIIEDLGGLVCADSLCFGREYFCKPVETEGDLLGNLARAYLDRPSRARVMGHFSEKDDYLERMIREYCIDGVIHQRIRYCDPWGGDLLRTRKKLKEMNIPLLVIEREYWPTGIGQLRTRVQAFLESIETRRER